MKWTISPHEQHVYLMQLTLAVLAEVAFFAHEYVRTLGVSRHNHDTASLYLALQNSPG